MEHAAAAPHPRHALRHALLLLAVAPPPGLHAKGGAESSKMGRCNLQAMQEETLCTGIDAR